MWENRKNLAKTGLFYYSLVIMNEIYLAKNHLMIKTEYKDPEMHRHSAAHILISLKGPVRFQVDGQEMTGFGAVIPSGLPHTVCGAPDEEGKPFSMPSLLLFLFDETTFVAQCIRESRLITEKQAQTVLQWYRDMREAADAAAAYPSFLRKVLKELGLPASLQAVGDERIRQAYVYIDEHIGSDMTVASIASHFCMSESRFSHLFRKEAGMSVANYLVFRKLYFTYLGLMKGKNITTAALDAGFSDPSHFAATNKRMFGIPPTAVSGSMKIITIAEI
ncbi:putative uncharacterized protein [Clostridium sp. CAG:510]|nr:putative uncharacterized protein [Clostridium sp. CAG:510]